MKIRTPVTGLFLIVSISGAILAGSGSAEAISGKAGSIDGFGKLTWGITVEQAEKAYPDLYFGVYEMVSRKEEPVKIFYRNASPEKIDGVVFESYEYWFQGDRFSRVKASLHSKIGPRTLVTRAEASWDQMVDHLRRKYGEPKEHRADFTTEYLVVVKEMRWEVGGVFIHLKYKGPEGANVDQLIFEMGK